MRFWIWLVVVVILTSGGRSVVLADDVEAIVKRGADLRAAGKDREALAEFQRAAQINRTPRVAAQIGAAEMALGIWLAAAEHLREGLAHGEDPWIAKNRAPLEKALATVMTHVGSIEVWGTPPGAEVLIDGRRVGRFPLERPALVAAGSLTVTVQARGYQSVIRTLQVGAEVPVRENIDLARVVPAPVGVGPQSVETSDAKGPPSSVATPGDPYRRLAWISLGGAVAAGALGTIEVIVWHRRASAFDNHVGPLPGSPTINGPNCAEQEPMRGGTGCTGIYNDMTRAKTLSIVGLSVGAVLGAASTVLFVTSRGSASPSSVAFTCSPAFDTRGVGCRINF